MMADLGKVKRNVAKMVGLGAPESDIDDYIASEGTTIDAVRAFKDTAAPTLSGSAMDAAQGYQPPMQLRTVNPDGSPREGVDLAALQSEGQPAAPRMGGIMGVGAGATQAGKGMVPQGLSGVNEGIANSVGFPVDAVNSALKGVGLPMSDAPVLGSQYWKNVMGSPVPGGDARMIYPENGDPADRLARTAGRGIGSTAVMGPATGLGLIPTIATGVGSGLGGATGDALSGGNPWGELAGGIIGGAAGGGLAAAVDKYVANNAARTAVPSIDALKGQYKQWWDATEKTGITFKPETTQEMSAQMRAIGSKSAVVSPTGRINTAYPNIGEAIRFFDDYAGQPMNVEQMRAARQLLSDAVGSGNPGEAYKARQMLEAFDDFVKPYLPGMDVANAAYTKAMRAEDIGKAIDLAEAAAPRVGLDKALQSEFAKLERQVINGTLKGLSDDEIAAIRAVASGGGNAQTLARWAAKLWPSNPMAAGVGQGVPFAVGSALGGPGVGGMASAASLGLGAGGKAVADTLAARSANTAALVARNGGALPTPDSLYGPVAAALAAAQGANGMRPTKPAAR